MLHPYQFAPHFTKWNQLMHHKSYRSIDPVIDFPFQLTVEDKIATAGSCFAQHISEYLQNSGYNYYIQEKQHSLFSEVLAKKYNFGIFSCRYGNIYTSTQLLQLFDRAFGLFNPIDDIWETEHSLVDPFRPTIEPGGYTSAKELLLDRENHLQHLRIMFRQLDYFIFTLGLTEHWHSREDHAVYPLCPGVSGGVFDANKHAFKNNSMDEVVSDMNIFFGKLKEINPKAKMILTISPVPLMATAENKPVLLANTVSKATLRLAAETICRSSPDIAYFPSYEIITGNYDSVSYYDTDRRSVTKAGVEHVMSLFLKHVMNNQTYAPVVNTTESEEIQKTKQVLQSICDEEKYGL